MSGMTAKGFIEVTEKYRRMKVFLAVNTIISVSADEDGAFIETGYNEDCESTGMHTRESYSDVVGKIKTAVG